MQVRLFSASLVEMHRPHLSNRLSGGVAAHVLEPLQCSSPKCDSFPEQEVKPCEQQLLGYSFGSAQFLDHFRRLASPSSTTDEGEMLGTRESLRPSRGVVINQGLWMFEAPNECLAAV